MDSLAVHDTKEDFFHHHDDSIQWHQHLLTIDEFEIKLEYQRVFVSKKKKRKSVGEQQEVRQKRVYGNKIIEEHSPWPCHHQQT